MLGQVRSRGSSSDRLVLKRPRVLHSPGTWDPAVWPGPGTLLGGLGLLPRPACLPVAWPLYSANPGSAGRGESACLWPRKGELLGGDIVRNGFFVQHLLPVTSGGRARGAHFQAETPVSHAQVSPADEATWWHRLICLFQPSLEEWEDPRKSAGPGRSHFRFKDMRGLWTRLTGPDTL